MIVYTIVSILAWLIMSLVTTWLFGYFCDDGPDDGFAYFLHICCWPILLVGLICIVIFMFLYQIHRIVLYPNILWMWEKAAEHGRQKGHRNIYSKGVPPM